VSVSSASGSALKAIYTNGKFALTAGYDQRVCLWRREKLTWHLQSVMFSECADIAGIGFNARTQEIVVIGKGMQILLLKQ